MCPGINSGSPNNSGRMFFHGEALIDVSKIDAENEELMAHIRDAVNSIFDDAERSLADNVQKWACAVHKAEEALQKTDLNKIESRRSIISNILYFIGSIFAPEITPTEMYGKQELSTEDQLNIHRFHSDFVRLKAEAESKLQITQNFIPRFKEFHREAVSSTEKLLHFLDSANKAYRNNAETSKYYNSVFWMDTLDNAGYLEKAENEALARNGVCYENNNGQEKLHELNDWYMKTYGNSDAST